MKNSLKLSSNDAGRPGYPDDALRACDLLLAGSALVLLAPLMACLTLLVVLDSRGPVFLAQDRVGRNGRVFRMIKFRSMKAGADRTAPRFRLDSRGRMEPVIKDRKDDRVTRLGKFLRRYSLDELPQLANILRGEMSLIGPRPPLPEEAGMYTERQQERLAGVPGLTGLAQVSGRTDLDFDRIVELDLEYLGNRSLGLYLEILLRTVPFFLSGKSSY